MPTATLIDQKILNSAPQYVVALWQDTEGVAASSDSTSLIILNIPGLIADSASYLQEPRKRFYNSIGTGYCFAMQLFCFNISCNSTDFNVRLLNINDMTKLNTFNEILSYNNVNRKMFDSDLGNLFIVNRDLRPTSRLYLYISNNALVATGTINIEMVYFNLQDREY